MRFVSENKKHFDLVIGKLYTYKDYFNEIKNCNKCFNYFSLLLIYTSVPSHVLSNCIFKHQAKSKKS